MPIQNMPLWHKDHVELQAIKKQQTQEGSLLSLFLPKSKAYTSLCEGISYTGTRKGRATLITRDRQSASDPVCINTPD